MKKIVSLLAVFFVYSCSTSPVLNGDTSVVPANRVYKTMTNVGQSKLFVVRDVGFLGKMCSYGLFINDELIADLNAGEKLELNLEEGEYKIGVGSSKNNSGLCALKDIKYTEINLKSGQEKKYRMWFTDNDQGLSPL